MTVTASPLERARARAADLRSCRKVTAFSIMPVLLLFVAEIFGRLLSGKRV
jgi:hypothetical protein